MIRWMAVLFCLLAVNAARAEGTVISVFEVQNNTGATLNVTAVREEHDDGIPDLELAPGERRVMRLPVGNWRITASTPRVRGVDPVVRRFLLPDAGPYGIALAAGDFGRVRLEDGPWTDLPSEEDTADAAGLPPAVRHGIAAEYPGRQRSCERGTLSSVDPYFAYIPSGEACARPWSNGGFYEGQRVCRMCPDRTEWEQSRGCCMVR